MLRFMSEDEVSKLKKELADLKSKLDQMQNQQIFKTDSQGNIYDKEDNLVRDRLGNLYSAGKPIGDVRSLYPSSFGPPAYYPDGSRKEWHSDNEATYYYPDGNVSARWTKYSEHSETWVSYYRDGHEKMREETGDNGYLDRKEYWPNGNLKRVLHREWGVRTEEHYFEDGELMTRTRIEI
jgi:hypothetical protein